MSTTIAFANLGFGRSAAAHRTDVRAMHHEGASVICTVEDNTGQRERIRVSPSVQWERRGSWLAALSTRGYRIRLRRIAWVDVEFSGIGMVRVVVVHMPPRRMPGLVGVYALRLRRFLTRSPHPWIVAGDWNHFLHNDPADIRSRFGARWYGTNQGDRRDGPGTIDGYAVHPALTRHVRRVRNVDQGRRDGHPFVLLTLLA